MLHPVGDVDDVLNEHMQILHLKSEAFCLLSTPQFTESTKLLENFCLQSETRFLKLILTSKNVLCRSVCATEPFGKARNEKKNRYQNMNSNI